VKYTINKVHKKEAFIKEIYCQNDDIRRAKMLIKSKNDTTWKNKNRLIAKMKRQKY